MYNLFPTLNLGNIIQQKDIIMLQISQGASYPTLQCNNFNFCLESFEIFRSQIQI